MKNSGPSKLPWGSPIKPVNQKKAFGDFSQIENFSLDKHQKRLRITESIKTKIRMLRQKYDGTGSQKIFYVKIDRNGRKLV